METARRLEAGKEIEEMGMDVLTLAALSILITAPIGTLAIEISGPYLLSNPITEVPDNAILLELVPVTDGTPSCLECYNDYCEQ